jgi:predicted site-specific integrase-resolvase
MNDLTTGSPAVISLNKWLAQSGISTITAWRWRKKGWLQTINVAGRQYITGTAIAEFTRRAESGEFATEHKVPRKTAASIQ